MRISGARDQGFDDSESDDKALSIETNKLRELAETSELSGDFGQLSLPKFDADIYAVTARNAGRLNAASISPEEHKALLRERQQLLDKTLGGTATRKDHTRLEYVRWSLDRIEDAKYGAGLEKLEASVSSYERLQGDLQHLIRELSKNRTSKRK